jgi:serine/threonine protein kinase
MIGRTIASYLLVEKIGEGGMGSVYRATDIVLEREVAIKAIRPELARDPEISERFRAEARLLARIQHPAIATIYTFLSEGPELFLVMEYVRGQSFARLLEKESRLPWRRATALIAAALEGIEPAHQLGIVHRDLKPENLMLSETGQVKIMDFGVARAIGSNRQTRTGLLVGSLHYMAPEQIRAEEVDCRTDVYSLGTVLYEMVTGRLPFAGASDYAVLRAQVEEEPAPPRQLAEEIPAWLEEVILTALAKDPAHRFATAAAMQQALLAAGTPAPRRFEALIAGTSPPDLSDARPARPETAVAPRGSRAAATPAPAHHALRGAAKGAHLATRRSHWSGERPRAERSHGALARDRGSGRCRRRRRVDRPSPPAPRAGRRRPQNRRGRPAGGVAACNPATAATAATAAPTAHRGPRPGDSSARRGAAPSVPRHAGQPRYRGPPRKPHPPRDPHRVRAHPGGAGRRLARSRSRGHQFSRALPCGSHHRAEPAQR